MAKVQYGIYERLSIYKKVVFSRNYFVQDIAESVKEINLRRILDTFVSMNVTCIFIKSASQYVNITV